MLKNYAREREREVGLERKTTSLPSLHFANNLQNACTRGNASVFGVLTCVMYYNWP